MVWNGMETVCRLALIYRWSLDAKTNKSQNCGFLNSEVRSIPKIRKKEENGRELNEKDTPPNTPKAHLGRTAIGYSPWTKLFEAYRVFTSVNLNFNNSDYTFKTDCFHACDVKQ